MNEEYFWSICLEQDLVQAGLWTIRGDNVAILAVSPAIAWESDEDLVNKVDEALSAASADFPDDAREPNKTVFGVPSSWVEDGKIKRPHLEKVRLVSQKLSLNPTGFVVLPEAIAHSVKVKEGSPLSGVVIGVGTGSLDLTVFRLGNIVGTVSVGRSTSITEDVVEGLSRFSASDAVPTRWLLYDGKEIDLEDTKQELLHADWGEAENLKMLHTPKIEVISVKEKAEAVSIAGASEMGEIKGIEGRPATDESSNILETHDVGAADLGFVIDQNIEKPQEEAPLDAPFETHFEPHVVNKPFLITAKFAPLLAAIKRFKLKLPTKKMNTEMAPPAHSKNKKKRILITFAVLLGLIIIGLMAAWVYLPHADVIIYIAPKNLQDAQVVTLDENISSPDLENLIFPAEATEIEVTSEKSKSATGTKTVGDKAVGKVAIRNGTASEVDFDAGTTLESSNGLSFVLDEGVTVPEASSPSSPGTVSVAATATDIGGEYNLATDESLAVGNFPKSEVDAIVEEAFSGGSSREITAVAAGDITSLSDELQEELESEAKKQLEAEAGNARFVADAVRFEMVDESVSAKAGDEADSVTITKTISARGLVLPEEQIAELAQLILKDQVPEGFSLRSEQVEAEFNLVDEVDPGVWEFDINLSANLLPSVDTDVVRADIAGKNPESVKEYLARIPGYVRAVVTNQPKLPGFLGNLPRIVKNISIEIVAEQ